MSKFIVIEIGDNPDYEIDADYIRNVANLVEESFIAGLDKQARFETINTLNHQELYDVVQAVRENDK